MVFNTFSGDIETAAIARVARSLCVTALVVSGCGQQDLASKVTPGCANRLVGGPRVVNCTRVRVASRREFSDARSPGRGSARGQSRMDASASVSVSTFLTRRECGRFTSCLEAGPKRGHVEISAQALTRTELSSKTEDSICVAGGAQVQRLSSGCAGNRFVQLGSEQRSFVALQRAAGAFKFEGCDGRAPQLKLRSSFC